MVAIMTADTSSHSISKYVGRGFSVMLLLLFGLAIVSAFKESRGDEGQAAKLALLVAAMIFGLKAAEVKRRTWRFVIPLVVLVPVWEMLCRLGVIALGEHPNYPSLILIIFTLGVTFAHVVRTDRVTPDKIYGAICVYFLLAAFWAFLYQAVVNWIGVDAFRFGDREGIDINTELFYFSWVTLSTLGYGDITPVHSVARVLANMECIVGQFYLVVVVARLVALQITHKQGLEAG